MPLQTGKVSNNFNGNLFYRNEFDNKILDPRFVFLRNPEDNLYSLSSKKGFLILPLKSATVFGKENPVFIGFRQQNILGYASAAIVFNTVLENEKAGLLIFQNETHYYFLRKSAVNNREVVQLYKSAANAREEPELLASQKLSPNKELQLKIEAKADTYAFYYAEKKNNWVLLKDNVNGKFLSTKIAGGFVGSLYTLYGTSGVRHSNNVAQFNWFEYKGNDAAYK